MLLPHDEIYDIPENAASTEMLSLSVFRRVSNDLTLLSSDYGDKNLLLFSSPQCTRFHFHGLPTSFLHSDEGRYSSGIFFFCMFLVRRQNRGIQAFEHPEQVSVLVGDSLKHFRRFWKENWYQKSKDHEVYCMSEYQASRDSKKEENHAPYAKPIDGASSMVESVFVYFTHTLHLTLTLSSRAERDPWIALQHSPVFFTFLSRSFSLSTLSLRSDFSSFLCRCICFLSSRHLLHLSFLLSSLSLLLKELSEVY